MDLIALFGGPLLWLLAARLMFNDWPRLGMFVGVVGLVVFIFGLIANHRNHTRR